MLRSPHHNLVTRFL